MINIKGRFIAISESEEVFYNSITSDGIQRILSLMGGQSTENWSSIRLVGSSDSIFVQNAASTEVKPGVLESTALFQSSEVTFEVQKIEMYAGNTLVATAPASLAANNTYQIVRQDFLSEAP